ncbi:unnamed protein product, partial [marine sediment metagenome]
GLNSPLAYYTGSYHWDARIVLTPLYKYALYTHSDGGEVALEKNVYSKDPMVWNKLDLSVNFAVVKYHWLCLQKDCWDLSEYACRGTTDITNPRMDFTFKIISQESDAQAKLYLDEILITNELYSFPT